MQQSLQTRPRGTTPSADCPLTPNAAVTEIINEALTRLTADEATTIRRVLRGEVTPEISRALRHLSSLEAFRNADTNTMTLVLGHVARSIARDQPGIEIQWLLRQANFARLSINQQRELVALIDPARNLANCAEPLGFLLERNGTDGRPALLSTDRNGRTLLSHLTALSTLELYAPIRMAGVRAPEVFRSALQEIGRPENYVGQGNRGACGPASVYYLLCRQNPAEAARVTREIFSTGSAALHGDPLRIVPDSLAADRRLNATGSPDLRSQNERIIQSAIMAYSSSLTNYSYTNDSDTISVRSVPALETVTRGLGLSDAQGSIRLGSAGMTDAGIRRVLRGLFGGEHVALTGTGPEVHEALRRHGQPAVIWMRWTTGEHALVYCGTREGNVYLFDPNGPSLDETSPPRTPARYNGSNIRMSTAEFERRIRQGYIPRPTTSNTSNRP